MEVCAENYIRLNQFEINERFHAACSLGNLDLVRYLLTSKEIPIKAQINYDDGQAIISACSNGYIKIVDYLLTSSELEEKINVHNRHDYLFRIAHLHKKLDILEYLIFDFGITETKIIKRYVEQDPKTIKMFINRDLNKELDVSKQKQKYSKI